MPTVMHKQRPTIANTTVGSTAGFAMMVGAVSVCKGAGWKYAGSSDGTTVNKTTDPAQDRWNTTPGTIGSLTASGSGALIGAPTRGKATITGLTGVVATWKGQFLKIAGSTTPANNNCHQIEEILSPTSVKIDARNFAVAADGVGRSWEVRDPLTEAISTARRWWCGIGPHTLKIPITAYPSTRMLPGERIVQATSGFEGELRDVVWNAGSSTGYLTVMGQVRGTGGGVYGLSNGQLFTGQTSGGTVLQVGTAKEFRMEMVIFQGTSDLTGSVHYGCFDVSSDTRFSALVASAGCTATVPPGGGGTGNAYPTYAWCAWGGSSAASWTRALTAATADTDVGWAICADALEEQGYSADGSYMAGTLHRYGNAYQCQGLQLCDGGDYGDLAPWVSWTPYSNDLCYTAGVTNIGPVAMWNANATVHNTYLMDVFNSATVNSQSHNFLRGWSRRGFGGSYDRFQMYDFSAPTCSSDLAGSGTAVTTYPVFHQRAITGTSGWNNGEPMRSNNHDEPVASLVPVGVGAFRSGPAGNAPLGPFPQHKGRFRWIKIVDGGHLNTLHHDGSFLQLAASASNFCVGPFNGVAPTFTAPVAGRLYFHPWAYIGLNTTTPNNIAGSRWKPDGTLIDTASGIPVDPGGAAWEGGAPEMARNAALTRYKMRLSAGQISFTNFNPGTLTSRLCRSYISPPLAAQTISGTVKGQVWVSVTVTAAVYVQSRLYVLTPQGTVRGVIRELLPNSDVSGGLAIVLTTTNRKLFRNGTLTPLAVQAGDYLVYEMGANNTSGTSTQVRFQVADDATADLPENETQTTAGNTWIEFSTPLVFLDSGGSQN